ncbi:hypothetical protein OPQ81_000377 [Rhizoctonia solani]|nr:hypothetical protein OPQ81_000377 [Rhizoctonia solani]
MSTLPALEDTVTGATILAKVDRPVGTCVQSLDSDSKLSDKPEPGGQNDGIDQLKTQPLFREEKRGIWTLYYPISWGSSWKVPYPISGFEWNTPKVIGAFNDLWRFICEVFSLAPFALAIYLISSAAASVVPSLRLRNDSHFLDFEFKRIVTEYAIALLVGLILRKLKTHSELIVERRVAQHFDKQILSVQSRLELGPSEDPVISSKISRVGGCSSQVWSSLSSITDAVASAGEVVAVFSILKGQLISPEGVNLFGVWALVSPFVSELSGRGSGKVFFSKITNLDWIRKEAFSRLGTWEVYKKEILSSGLEDYINSEYRKAASNLGDVSIDHPIYTYSMNEGLFGLEEFSRLLDSVPLLFCTWNAVHGYTGSSLAAMVKTQQTSSVARNAIWGLIYRWRDIFSLFQSITTLYEVIEMNSGIEDGNINYPDEEHAEQKGMAIEFRNVSFGYPSAPNKVLKDLSFKIEPGQLCVIVGENGCGKSTTINLINRLYDCNSGEILIDGRPIRDYKVSTLRAAGNIMYQDYHHFPFTIKENILMGRPDSEDPVTDIENAAKLGGAYDFIQKLPLGLDTNLEPISQGYVSPACGERELQMFKPLQEDEKPTRLSGGEWQRLAVSRTFMKNSEKTRLLCYDEPSASLDPKAEAGMFERLRNLRGEKTMIFVTHRFGHLTKHADLIIYISEGSVIEQGTHKSLLAQGGEYAKMYNIQSEAFAA